MEKTLEDELCQAVLVEDQCAVLNLLSQGANPNKTTSHGITSLGKAAYIGNISFLKLLLDASKMTASGSNLTQNNLSRNLYLKSYKRKYMSDSDNEETVTKCKNANDRLTKDIGSNGESTRSGETSMTESNQGYYVFIHNEDSNDLCRISTLKSPVSPISQTPSPQADLEWDEEIGNVAPTTIEDETWTSMLKWYADILELTGAAIEVTAGFTNGVDQHDTSRRTALHYAVEQGHFSAVKLLLEAGCKLDIEDSEGLTPLHMAVINNHIDIVKTLINVGCDVNQKTDKRMHPLHFASRSGHLQLVQILVKHGADVDSTEDKERTPLFLSAKEGHLDVVKYLIDSGANVNREDLRGHTPVCAAVWSRHPAVVRELLARGARVIPSHRLLHNAIYQKQDDIINVLVKYSGINLHNDNGDTPLLLAARLVMPKVARLLLQNGANPNARNSVTLANALQIAMGNDCITYHEFEELLKCLQEYNMNMDTIGISGDTALNRALWYHRVHIAALLIRYGANLNICDKHHHRHGDDHLTVVTNRGSYTLAWLLLKAGYKVRRFVRMYHGDPGDNGVKHWLYCISKTPLSLCDLVRIKIRRMHRRRMSLYSFVKSLPLPVTLQNFLMMEGEDLEVQSVVSILDGLNMQ